MNVDRNAVSGLNLQLSIDGVLSFQLLATEDGALSRLGPLAGQGRAQVEVNDDNVLVTGRADPALFAALRDALPSVLLEHVGTWVHPDIRGHACDLSVLLQTPGATVGIHYRYGSDSQGPPADIMDFVRRCVVSTEDWAAARAAASPEPGPQG
ncbi:hypothetical protein [Roseateles amylovorans]|uniref:DUF1795 domain-containing protein n=1 Tax=Roseateles amylovorans TaxID=2978473 RepID=A0ABY6AYZ3_9BURK|nr:hypothetical protein [Roseateles amylovorans]UXH77805.1 hypothetical protein N4261_22980 [Roseateles amylovorans]